MTDLYHIESEQSVLGGLLLDPKAHDRIDFLREDDFYRADHRTIYRCILLMLAQRKDVDAITVAESLASTGSEEETGGLAYLGQLAANTPSAANIKRYAEVVAEKRMLRDLLAASNEIADLAQRENSMPVDERIDKAQGLVFALSERQLESQSEPELVGSVLSSVIEDIEERFQRGGAISGLSTGFIDLDEKTAGMHPGDLIIIAGRPSMGKTAIAINIAEHVAINEGKSSLVFSMEMGKKQLTERSIANIGSIDHGLIRSGRLTDDDFSRLSFATAKLHKSKLIIDDSPALSVMQMRSRARRVAKKHGLDLIVIDYMQLARGEGQNREQEISSISRGLKALAKELGVPVIALSQLSRKVEERADKRPMMSDLRESGAIEQDADVIISMYREEYYKPDTQDKGIAEACILKQRMGQTGIVPLLFQGEYSRFRNLSSDERMHVLQSRAAEKPMKRSRGME